MYCSPSHREYALVPLPDHPVRDGLPIGVPPLEVGGGLRHRLARQVGLPRDEPVEAGPLIARPERRVCIWGEIRNLFYRFT